MISERPLLSVIVPTFESGVDLQNLLNSLIAVDSRGLRFEVIIVDGASSDNTLEVISRFQRQLDIMLISNSDRGMTDAIMIGLSLASGHWFIEMNSDEEVCDGLFHALVNYSDYCDVILGRRLKVSSNRIVDRVEWVPSFWLKVWVLYGQGLIHTDTTLIRIDKVFSCNGYDSEFQTIGNDVAFSIRLLSQNIRCRHCNFVFSIFVDSDQRFSSKAGVERLRQINLSIQKKYVSVNLKSKMLKFVSRGLFFLRSFYYGKK